KAEQNRKENDEVPVADGLDPWSERIEHASQHRNDGQGEYELAPAAINAADQARQEHEHDAHRQGGSAKSVIKAERRRMNEGLVLGEIVSRAEYQQQEHRRRCSAESLKQAAHSDRALPDKRGHPHMLSATLRDSRAEHRQPKEHDGSQLIRPGQW